MPREIVMYAVTMLSNIGQFSTRFPPMMVTICARVRRAMPAARAVAAPFQPEW